MEGKSIIRKFLPLIRGFWGSGMLRLRNARMKAYQFQRDLASFIKEHRTVKLLHLLRNYSALVVVVSSTILVASTNVAAGKSSSGFLFGYWENGEGQSAEMAKKIEAQKSRKNDLALVPLAKTKTTIDPQALDEEAITTNLIQGQSLVAAINNPQRDPEEGGGVKIYTVQNGDTVSAIAAKNHITVNTILWANDIDNVDSIMPGDKIFILPVAGVSHTVKSGETLDSIAKKYKADRDKIIAFNGLPADGSIKEGEEIVIPGGEKEIAVPSPASSSSTLRRQYATPQGGAPAVSGFKKLEGKAGAGHRFPYGYCTWYVAQRRYVPWGGNAGTWLYNAKSAGYLTGKTPRVGAILVTAESWWGHVAIVESVGSGSITVSEMNYAKWGKTDRRTISTSSRVIKGYIY